MADPPPTDKQADPPVDSSKPSPTPQSRLETLIAEATAKYAVKDYLPAAELYSQATELQAEMNGEMAVENADLLYSYGKCLYFVGVKNSDVLGGEAAGVKLPGAHQEDAKPKKSKSKHKSVGQVEASSSANPATNGARSAGEEQTLPTVKEDDTNPEGKEDPNPASDLAPSTTTTDVPFFAFTGDENFDDSSSDSDAPSDAENDDADDDDFANAFEVLDLARILYQKQAPTPASAPSSSNRHAVTRLADIHDLQAEIALESERYSAAVDDLRSALSLLQNIHPISSPTLAECHYKLSLALEFAAVTQQRDPQGNPVGEAELDSSLRAEAVSEMEAAIASCRARIERLETQLAAAAEEKEDEKKRTDLGDELDEVKSITEDMTVRLAELRKGPVELKGGPALGKDEVLAGLLGKIAGQGGDEEMQKTLLQNASVGARDLSGSGLVKRKKEKGKEAEKDESVNMSAGGTGKGKRKADDDDGLSQGGGEGLKRVRVEDLLDDGT